MHFEESEEQRLALMPGDLLVCEGGDIGRTAIWDGQIQPCYYQNHLHRLRSRRPDVVPTFYMYWLETAWTILGLYGGAGNKTTIPNLSQSRLSSFPIPLPPLAEQRAIAHVLRTVQQAKEATGRVIAALKEVKKSLMRHLFTYGPTPLDATERVPLRETEVGPVPAHWQVVRLGEIAQVRAGVAFPHKYQGTRTGKYPFYKVSDMNAPGNEVYMKVASNWVDEDILAELRAKTFPRDTIVFPKVGGALLTNKKRILAMERLTDNNVMGIVINQESMCEPRFCFYWFESIDIRQFSNPGPLPSINAQTVKESCIPLPPLPEQQEIARILQAVDAKIAAEEGRREALAGLFKSLLAELMSGRRRIKFTAENAESAENIEKTLRPLRSLR